MALSTEILVYIAIGCFGFGILLIWFWLSWSFRGAIVSTASKNIFDMNINEMGDVDFKIAKVNPAGFIIVDGLPKKIKDKSAIMLGKAKGILSYSSLAMSLRPQELAAISSLSRSDRKQLTNLMNRKLFFDSEFYDDDPELKEELEKDIGGPLTEEEERTLAKILDKEVLVNEFQSVRLADVIAGLNDTPSAIEMKIYADEELRQRNAEQDKTDWIKLIMPLGILIIIVAIAKLIMTPSYAGMVPEAACRAIVEANKSGVSLNM
jgi:hypothetical protein